MSRLAASSLVSNKQYNNTKFEVQGHRGNPARYSENTIPGFLSVLDTGVDTLELDLLLTKDNGIVIHHNYRLNPKICLNDDGSSILTDDMKTDYIVPESNHLGGEDERLALLKTLTVEELQQYDVGCLIDHNKYPKSRAVPHTRIPTLNELFEAVTDYYKIHPESSNKHHIRFNLEIKRSKLKPNEVGDIDVLIPTVLSIVKEYNMEKHVKYSSFDIDILRCIRKYNNDAIIALLYEPVVENEPDIVPCNKKLRTTSDDYTPSEVLQYMVALATDLKANIIGTSYKTLHSPDDIAYLKYEQNGKQTFQVVCYTVNDKEEWEKLIDYGLDGIITDYPLELLDYMDVH
eukprot:TRINITY_DN10479_c0_g1_i1.p1 TRINITY_DN10479_c0_g1~~TRINITY_DN10479_c0_g1_i1.p1  ORF type:complete len:346 (+),score=-2.44 TRINITY_DN10479_c0_g1_i1:76-1113(+)